MKENSDKNNLGFLVREGKAVLEHADFLSAGISKYEVQKLHRDGEIIRISHGRYIPAGKMEDEMYIFQQINKRAIFSHETALYLHGFSDRDPLKYSVTVPSGYNAAHIPNTRADVYYIKEDLHKMGMTQSETVFGNEVCIYNVERTLCDIVKNRRSIDPEILSVAFKNYQKYKHKKINLLIGYAQKMRVWNILRKYLEVIL